MLVILSWLVFWIPQDAVPARVALGSTTVLSIVTFTGSFRNTLPKVRCLKGHAPSGKFHGFLVRIAQILDWRKLSDFTYEELNYDQFFSAEFLQNKGIGKLEKFGQSFQDVIRFHPSHPQPKIQLITKLLNKSFNIAIDASMFFGHSLHTGDTAPLNGSVSSEGMLCCYVMLSCAALRCVCLSGLYSTVA